MVYGGRGDERVAKVNSKLKRIININFNYRNIKRNVDFRKYP